MEDFQRITHHETDYSGTEGRRKKKIKERVREGEKCENAGLARRSEMVPGSGDVSEGPVPLSIPPTSLPRLTLFLQSLCNCMLMACRPAASLCGDTMLAHKVQCVDSTYQ